MEDYNFRQNLYTEGHHGNGAPSLNFPSQPQYPMTGMQPDSWQPLPSQRASQGAYIPPASQTQQISRSHPQQYSRHQPPQRMDQRQIHISQQQQWHQPQHIQPNWQNNQQHHMPHIQNSFPLLPHPIHDNFRQQGPIGTHPKDEEVIVNALCHAKMKGLSYREALDNLHDVHHYAAHLWKDYYLDNIPRIDHKVQVLMSHKNPHFSSNASQSMPVRSEGPSKQPNAGQPNRNNVAKDQVELPPVPSRSPTPPQKIVVVGGRNRYTEEDKDYFIKFISWELKCNPDQSRLQLCDKLAEKVPHHSSSSWGSHWSSRSDVADKILSAAHGVDFDAADSSEEEEEVIPVRRTRRKPSTPSDKSESGSEASGGSESEYDPAQSLSSDDESAMGLAGAAFTDGDLRIAAKFVASTPNWGDQGAIERWTAFNTKYPRRSIKSWAEYYRRNKDAIDTLAKSFMKKRAPGSSSRASTTASLKRKPSAELDEKRGTRNSRRKSGA